MIEAPRNPSPLSFVLPGLEVTVQASNDTLARTFHQIAPRATATFRSAALAEMALSHDAEGYGFVDAYGESGRARTAWIASQHVLATAHRLALAGFPAAVRMSAVMLHHKGSAVLLAGGAESGRSTLALALALAGRTIGSDDGVLIDGGMAYPIPQRSSVWTSSLDLLAGQAGGRACEVLRRDTETHTRILIDPTDLGGAWLADPAPVSAILWIDPNFGGTSRLRRVGSSEMSRLLLQHCAPPEQGGFWVGPLFAMIASVETAVLELGSLDSAIAALSLFLEHLPGSPPQGGGDTFANLLKPFP